jgi:hypothetical protein
MRYPITCAALAFYLLTAIGCSKNNDYSAGLDHTKGAVAQKKWSGTTDGYCQYDSSYYDTASHHTVHITWPKHFQRTITDTIFSLERMDDYMISGLGQWQRYRSTDSANGIIHFDTTYSGSTLSYINYWYRIDSEYFEHHKVGDHHEASGLYYQTHWYLHTVH